MNTNFDGDDEDSGLDGTGSESEGDTSSEDDNETAEKILEALTHYFPDGSGGLPFVSQTLSVHDTLNQEFMTRAVAECKF